MLMLCQEYSKDGVSVRGREAIAQRLAAIAEYHAAMGGGGHVIDCIKTQRAQVGLTVL